MLVATVEITERKNSLEDELNETIRQVEEGEGKTITQILDEAIAETRQTERIIRKIDGNGLRQHIEKREGKRLEQVSTTRLSDILKELKIE